MTFNKLIIFLTLFLFSCSSHFIQAEEVKPNNLKCGSNSSIEFFEKNGSFNEDDKDFSYKLRLIDKNLDKNDFNFMYISKPRSSGGYILKVEKIIKRNDKHEIYLKEIKPPEGSSNIAATTATYCFLKIGDLNKFNVIIN